MKKSILLVACLSGCSFSNIQTKMLTPSKLDLYRAETLGQIRKHSEKHTVVCILNNLYTTVETMPIEWFSGDLHTAAYVHDGTVFINRNMGISVKDGSITILHEAIHLQGLCLNDAYESKTPICYVFDKPVYYSPDLTKHIIAHLKEFN